MSIKRSRQEDDSQEILMKKRKETVPLETVNKRQVKFLIMSDTHDTTLTSDRSSAFRLPTPQVDVLLHCGDLTQNGDIESLKQATQMLQSIPAELKLFIAGNHEITLDRTYYLNQGGTQETVDEAVKLCKEASQQGIFFLEEGVHSFTLKDGATFSLYASPYTPQYGESAFQYPSAQDRYNPPEQTPPHGINVATPTSIIPEGIDIVMTHGPPKYILDATGDGRSAGCEHLRRAISRAAPRLHCFGHIHAAYGVQRIRFAETEEDGIELLPKEFVGKNSSKRRGYATLSPSAAMDFKDDGTQCLLVNASILGDEELNAPWMVELELPIKERKS